MPHRRGQCHQPHNLLVDAGKLYSTDCLLLRSSYHGDRRIIYRWSLVLLCASSRSEEGVRMHWSRRIPLGYSAVGYLLKKHRPLFWLYFISFLEVLQ